MKKISIKFFIFPVKSTQRRKANPSCGGIVLLKPFLSQLKRTPKTRENSNPSIIVTVCHSIERQCDIFNSSINV